MTSLNQLKIASYALIAKFLPGSSLQTSFGHAMMFSGNNYQNRLIDVTAPTSGTFVEKQMYFGSQPTTVRYLETDHGFFVQPTKRHYKAQFEDFFGLDCGNLGFSDKKTVYVPKVTF